MNKSKPFILIEDIHKHFGDQHVLKGVSVEIYHGETVVLLGGSGGGKSVLLKHMIGLLQPDKGEVYVDCDPISELSERQLGVVRKKIGMMFQGGALFDSMTVAENIAFPLIQSGEKDSKVIQDKVCGVLDIVKLSGMGDKMPSEISGGMRKRVALARAIVDKPECVLYDEPHAGLDPITGDTIDHLIKALQRDHNITNVIITHEIRSVFRIADRVIFMKDGQIYFHGTPDEMKKSEDPILKNFIEGNSGEDWSKKHV
ncbi:ATP-binding cassette domain-containing protein [Akkermansiaceae bacterium]|nr:ATP-binding cassette domain-containing protein [Akkermansiaceae bacterium]